MLIAAKDDIKPSTKPTKKKKTHPKSAGSGFRNRSNTKYADVICTGNKGANPNNIGHPRSHPCRKKLNNQKHARNSSLQLYSNDSCDSCASSSAVSPSSSPSSCGMAREEPSPSWTSSDSTASTTSSWVLSPPHPTNSIVAFSSAWQNAAVTRHERTEQICACDAKVEQWTEGLHRCY